MNDELFDDNVSKKYKQEIGYALVSEGLSADGIRESLGGNNDTSLSDMLLNMPTNKTSCLVEYGQYLNYSTTYSELLFKFNKLNTTRKWRFKRYAAKQRVNINYKIKIQVKFNYIILIYRYSP